MEKQSSWPIYVICIGITITIFAFMFWPKSETANPTPNPILDQLSSFDTLSWKTHKAETFSFDYPSGLTPLAIANSVDLATDDFVVSFSEHKPQTQIAIATYAEEFMNQDIALGREIVSPIITTSFRGTSALTFVSSDQITKVEKKYIFFPTPKGIFIKIAQTIYSNPIESQKTIDQILNSLEVKG